ncbi:LysM peptidoglycan-binding domain-containing protein [Prosthecobacter sp. SYSU 5D2]|uniref:LysM peptidoglycan-binding domain-containing protein n=1 Tax=Prosthecobacter sp. SYSU 5D2 TaxID=3134134 RepID=UPI0031FEA49E
MIPAARLLTFAAVCSLLTSCQNGQSLGGNDPYVSNYGNDGGYNPYPGQPGYAQGGSSSSIPTYTPPPAPVEADPYAFNAPTSSSSSSGSSSYTAPKKTTTSSSKPKTSTKSTAKKSSGSGSYKVVSGDTLYGIARKRSTTVAKIKSANGLKSDLIRPGQTLKIP